jgi:membrane protein DedA with SNARE-associated domain
VIGDLVGQLDGALLSLWGPFFLLLICGFGFPMPEDIILVTAGFLAAQYSYPFMLVASITYAGIMIGDSSIYFMGTHFGRRFIRTRMGKFLLKEKTMNKVEGLFKKYGVWVIFIARFLPGLRTAVFFTSGTLHFSFWKFFLMDGLAALISAPLFVYLGGFAWKTFREDFSQLEKLIGTTKLYLAVGVGGLLVAVLLGYLFKQWLKKKGLQ